MESQEILGAGLGIGLLLVYLFIVVGLLVLTALVAWKITAKTGYPGVLGLLYFVPIANIVFLLIMAFSEWPVHREMKSLKKILERQGNAMPQPTANQQVDGTRP